MVNRCTCYKITFEEILKVANENDIRTLSDLQDKLFICNNCGLCNPYVEKILETGQIMFDK